MDSKTREKIKIHRTNLFQPIGQAISHIAMNPISDLIAVTKHLTTRSCKIDQSLTIVDILEISKKGNPSYLEQLVEYTLIKGIAWTGVRLLLTVSYEKNINIYDVTSGKEIFSLITDYGPIMCLKYSHEHRLILTGTSLGSVVAYRVDPSGRSVEVYRHLTRTNDQVQNLDFTFNQRKVSTKVVVKSNKRRSPNVRKRKRPSSKDSEEDNEDSEREEINEPDEIDDMTIYGTVEGRVTAWNLTKGTIIDSFHAVGHEKSLCSSLLTLNDGRIVTGDTSGNLSIYDDKSFTCQQTLKISDEAILCLAKNPKGSSIIASGMDPTIVVLKKDESDHRSYNLFEKSVVHHCPLSSAQFSRRKEFFTGGLDGLLVRHEVSKDEDRRKRKHTFITLPNYFNNISFCRSEMLFQKTKSLHIWRQPSSNQNIKEVNNINLTNKILNIKAKAFIHCSTFSDKWICFSTRRAFHIYERTGGELVEITCDIETKLSGRRTMILCCDNQCLVAGVGDRLYVIQLISADANPDQTEANGRGDSGIGASCKIVAEYNIKGTIHQLLYMPSVKQLVVVSGVPARYLTTFSLRANPEVDFSLHTKGTLVHPLLFVAHNLIDPKEDKNLYIFTIKNQLGTLRLSKSKHWNDQTLLAISQSKPISDLPDDIAPVGMLIVNDGCCLLYDNQRLYDIHINENRLNSSDERPKPDFQYIAKISALIEDNSLKYLIMIQIPPEDYLNSLPRLRNISLISNGKDRSIGSSSEP